MRVAYKIFDRTWSDQCQHQHRYKKMEERCRLQKITDTHGHHVKMKKQKMKKVSHWSGSKQCRYLYLMWYELQGINTHIFTNVLAAHSFKWRVGGIQDGKRKPAALVQQCTHCPFNKHTRSALLPPPRRLCFCQTLFVCLSVCQQDNSKSYGRIFLKFSGNVGNGKNYQWFNFGGDPERILDSGSLWNFR